MTDQAVCERCGTAVPAGARFCLSCGADVSGQQGGVATRQITRSATQQVHQELIEALRAATLGDYEVLAELGSGGMATVFLAHDIALGRKVAIKVMNPQLLAGAGMVERFQLEARTAAGLSHPNIIPIFAVKQQDDLLYFVMKFVEGRPLDSIIKQEAPLPIPMVRYVVSKVAEALGYAHRRGVIHRDIKPANIMIDTEGQPVVTDFGIAKVADKQGLTMTGATLGTPTYMSPEQCNALPITGASDQYSLGVMIYEMLTGKPLFEGESVMTIMYKHVNQPPPPPRDWGVAVPADLTNAVQRMVSKKPEDRFPSMEDIVKAVTAPTLAFDDPVRTKLVEFAMEGENRRVLQRVSTPRSPIPAAAPSRTRRAPGTSQAPAPPRRPAALIILGVVAAVALGVAVLRPWRGGSAGSGVATERVATTAAPLPPAAPSAPGDQAPARDARAEPPAEVRGVGEARRQPGASAVRSVRISGVPTSLMAGETVQLRAEALDAAGRPLPGSAIGWSSSAPDVVRVSPGGQVTGVAVGTASVTASAEGARANVALSVTPEAVADLTVTPGQLTLRVGEDARLSATVTGARGGALSPPVRWASSAAQIAAVSAEGVVTGRSPGSAVISASAQSRQGTANVTVGRAGPTEADLRQQVVATVQAYARALETSDIARVRQLYPGLTAAREQQLRQSLPAMRDLRVQLSVDQVRFTDDAATATVTGRLVFTADGRRQELPADGTYLLERRGDAWVITNIK